MGSGWLATENFNSLGSSHMVMGYTKLPVAKLQCLGAPTPRPSIVALIGYAIPVLKTNSVGSLSCGNAITFFQTCSGDALISIEVVTKRSSSLNGSAFSKAISAGTDRKRKTIVKSVLEISFLRIL